VGSGSDSGLGGGSFGDAGSSATDGGIAGSYGNPNSTEEPSDPDIWLPLLLVMLVLIPAAIWICIKVSRNSEEAAQNEVPYQTLDTEQILGKIIKK
jgi:hypothetical protein